MVQKVNTTPRNYQKELEEEVKSFLQDKLNFKDVKGGNDFHIGPPKTINPIAACGRYEDILFVFQCKAAGKKIKKDLKNEIATQKEKALITIKNYKRIPEYSKCCYVVIIFITKKIEVSEAQIETLEKTYPKIKYASEHILEYYSDLYNKIGEYAVYNFLADFGIRPKEKNILELTALKTKLGKFSVYSFYAKPKELLKYSYVARRFSTKEAFYQRMLEKSRIKKIEKFINDGGIFPTNIIISLKRGEKKFEKIKCPDIKGNIEIGKLTIKNSYNACWIIDGQHRLYSYAKSKSNDLIPCIAFDNIDVTDERKFFLEINKEQKPIPPDLIWDLEGLSQPESERGIVSNTVRSLNFYEPFKDTIYIPAYGTRSGKTINMAAFCNGIINARLSKKITPNCVGIQNPLYVYNHRAMVTKSSKIISKYFLTLKKYLKTEQLKFIYGNAGVPIMLYLLEPILAKIGKEPTTEQLSEYCAIIKKFFDINYTDPEQLKKLREESNSEFSRKNIAKQIGLLVRKEIKDDKFWLKMEEFEFVNNIIEMERRIGKLIAKELSDITTSWQKQRLPNHILVSAKKRMVLDGTDFDENFDLGDELEIIKQTNNWKDAFEKIFINKKGFLNIGELTLAFDYLGKLRHPAAHGKSVVISKDTYTQCGIYLNKFNKVVPEIIPELYNENIE